MQVVQGTIECRMLGIALKKKHRNTRIRKHTKVEDSTQRIASLATDIEGNTKEKLVSIHG